MGLVQLYHYISPWLTLKGQFKGPDKDVVSFCQPGCPPRVAQQPTVQLLNDLYFKTTFSWSMGGLKIEVHVPLCIVIMSSVISHDFLVQKFPCNFCGIYESIMTNDLCCKKCLYDNKWPSEFQRNIWAPLVLVYPMY